MPEIHDVNLIATDEVSASMYDYRRLVEKDELCRTLLGVDSEELVLLRDQLVLCGAKDPEGHAVTVLSAMARSFSFRDQASVSGQTRETFRRHAHEGLKMLATRFADSSEEVEGAVRFMSEEELRERVQAREELFEKWARDRAWMFVDGTSLVVADARAAKMSREFYVTYKGHAVRYTILVAADGTVLCITPAREGGWEGGEWGGWKKCQKRAHVAWQQHSCAPSSATRTVVK